MFALPFNFPFRKNDGSLSTIGAEISGGGGGGYTLPTATASRLGGIKVGANLSVTDDGTLSAPTPTPAYELPTASANTLGGVKIGSGITIDENGAISASGGGGGLNLKLYEKSVSTSTDTPPRLYGTISFDDIPSDAKIVSVQYTYINSSLPKHVVIFELNHTVTNWQYGFDIVGGAGVSTSGTLCILYV